MHVCGIQTTLLEGIGVQEQQNCAPWRRQQQATKRMLTALGTLRRVMKYEGDWRETERSGAATDGHVDRRQVVYSCGVGCEEGRSNRLTATVEGCSEMVLCFLSGRSVYLYPQCTNTKYSLQRRRRRWASCHNVINVEFQILISNLYQLHIQFQVIFRVQETISHSPSPAHKIFHIPFHFSVRWTLAVTRTVQ